MEVKRYKFVAATEHPTGERHAGTFVLASDFDAVAAERDALRRDAERYRWLAADAARGTDLMLQTCWKYDDQKEPILVFMLLLSDEIDAAMAGEAK
jgi:hypothetical protein